jgi:hypothetical protein
MSELFYYVYTGMPHSPSSYAVTLLHHNDVLALSLKLLGADQAANPSTDDYHLYEDHMNNAYISQGFEFYCGSQGQS